jgi:Uma2 family endonuclease
MASSTRWGSSDLEVLPDNGKRYEIIDGELYVSKQPHWYHQLVCTRLLSWLESFSKASLSGFANQAPGVIFADDDDVAPDVIWISNSRLQTALRSDGKLHAAPELVIEVLSPGTINERRDREAKLKLYSRRGVSEYWIVDWVSRHTQIYRRDDAQLKLAETLYETDSLSSPLMPGLSIPLTDLFLGIPKGFDPA